jgi:hypothetical protein
MVRRLLTREQRASRRTRSRQSLRPGTGEWPGLGLWEAAPFYRSLFPPIWESSSLEGAQGGLLTGLLCRAATAGSGCPAAGQAYPDEFKVTGRGKFEAGADSQNPQFRPPNARAHFCRSSSKNQPEHQQHSRLHRTSSNGLRCIAQGPWPPAGLLRRGDSGFGIALGKANRDQAGDPLAGCHVGQPWGESS